MVTFCQYRAISSSNTLHTITKPLISILFGIIEGVVVAGIMITEALRVSLRSEGAANTIRIYRELSTTWITVLHFGEVRLAFAFYLCCENYL